MPYLQEISTLQYYGKPILEVDLANVVQENELKFEDLRAIPFCRKLEPIKTNVPGFFVSEFYF